MPSVFADASWVGVWRIEAAEGATSAASLLVVSVEGDRFSPTLYTEAWRPQQLRSWKFEGESAILESQVTARAFELRLTRVGEKLEGYSALKHPQYRDRRDVIGYRLLDVNHWDPKEGLMELADPFRMIDISGHLIRNAPLESFAEFQKYWDREIKASYFRLFYPVLYRAGISSQQRQDRLKQIWNALRSERFQNFSKELAAQRTLIAKEFKENHSEFYFENHFVSMPAAGVFDTAVEQIEDAAYVLISTEHLMNALTSDQVKHWLVRWQLKLSLFAAVSPIASDAFSQIVREGIAAAWSVQLGFAEDPAEALGLRALGDASRAKAALREILPHLKSEGIPHADLMAAAAEFGDRIANSYSPEEIRSFSLQKWTELYVSFLTESPPRRRRPAAR